MIERAGRITLWIAIVPCMFFAFLAMVSTLAAAATVTPLEGVKFDVSSSLEDNLKSLVGKDVYVQLRSGKTYQGYVKSVGKSFIHLEKLVGRDFFDALVRIDDVSAIEVKFRDMK